MWQTVQQDLDMTHNAFSRHLLMSNDLLASILYPSHATNNELHFTEERGMWPIWFIPSSAVEGFLKSMIRQDKARLTQLHIDQDGKFRSADIQVAHPHEGDFVKVYFEGYKRLELVGGYTPVIAELCSNMSYARDGSIIYTNKAMLEDVAKKCNVSLVRVRHVISDLVKVDIFRRLALNKYQVNPHVIAKGYESEVMKLRKQFDDPNNHLSGIVIRDPVQSNDVAAVAVAFPDGEKISVDPNDMIEFLRSHGYDIDRRPDFTPV